MWRKRGENDGGVMAAAAAAATSAVWHLVNQPAKKYRMPGDGSMATP